VLDPNSKNLLVQYTTYLVPLIGTLGVALKLGRVPVWTGLFFLPGILLHVKFKLGWNYYSVQIPRPISSRLPPEKALKVRRVVESVEDEVITGTRIASSLGSLVLASRGLLGLAVLLVCYGLVTAEFLNQSRLRRWRKEIVDEAAEESEERILRSIRRHGGR